MSSDPVGFGSLDPGKSTASLDEQTNVFEGGVKVGTQARQLDFDANAFNITEDVPNDQADIALNFGSSAGTVCQGNDPRLSDARTPLAHTHVKADITDFAHTHVKADITDFAHTHTTADIISGVFAKGFLPTTTVYTDQANSYSAGMKQTFQGDGTNAPINLGAGVTPSSLVNGDVWITATGLFRARIGDNTKTYVNNSDITDFGTVTGMRFLNGTLLIKHLSTDSGTGYIFGTVATPAAARTCFIPTLTANDTFVFQAFSQALTNKDLTSGTNTFPTFPQSQITNLVIDLSNKQPLDSDLTDIAGLVPSNDDIIQRKAGTWTNRTMAQLKTDLALLLSNITDVTMTVANLNSLDDGVNSTLHFHDSDRARANHTGTQTRSTISDFAHATTHQSGGSDAIKLDDLASPDDNTDLNSSLTAHGLLPKLGGGTSNFLRADGTWASPGASSTDIKQTEIDFGDNLGNDDYLSFTVTDAGVGPTSQILVSKAILSPSDGRDIDEIIGETLELAAEPQTGQFVLHVKGLVGPPLGKFIINYLVG